MENFLPIVLGLAALAFILLPLWNGAAPQKAPQHTAALFSSDQLELDRELGKIDAAEYEELAPQVAALESPVPRVSVEGLIAAFRRQKRIDTALEVEVLVARARRTK